MEKYLTVGKLKEILNQYDDSLAFVVPVYDDYGYVESYNLVNRVAHLTDSTDNEIPEVLLLASHGMGIEELCSYAYVKPDKVLFEENLD